MPIKAHDFILKHSILILVFQNQTKRGRKGQIFARTNRKAPYSRTEEHRIPTGAWLFGHTQSKPRLCGLILASDVPLLLITPLFCSFWFCLPPLHQRVYALLVIPQAASLHSNIRLTPNQDNGIKPRRRASGVKFMASNILSWCVKVQLTGGAKADTHTHLMLSQHLFYPYQTRVCLLFSPSFVSPFLLLICFSLSSSPPSLCLSSCQCSPLCS